MPAKKRILKKFAMSELSAVDAPAVRGAIAVIAKRDTKMSTSYFDKAEEVAEKIGKLSEALTHKRGKHARDVWRLSEAVFSACEKQDGAELQSLLHRVVSVANQRLATLIDTLVSETGATRDQATLAAQETPLGIQLIAVRDLTEQLITAADDTSALLDTSELSKLFHALDQMEPTESVLTALVRVEAVQKKLRLGETVSADWLAKVRAQAENLIDNKEPTMTKSGNTKDVMSVLGTAERDQFGHLIDEPGTLAKMRAASGEVTPIAKSNSAADQLDALAKARASETGESFYFAYDAVASAHPELAAEAVAIG